MLIFWKARLVLLAVPKTGTTALEGALAPRADLVFRNPPELKHAPLYRFRRLVEPLLKVAGGEGFETVAVIREPVSWLGSWYRYRLRPELAGTPNSTEGMSFDEFVNEYCKGRPAPSAHVGSQAKFIADAPTGPGITHLFRYEDQERLLGFLTDRLGDLPPLQRRNVSPATEIRLSQGVERRLRVKRAAEFDQWARAGINPAAG